MKTTNKMKTIKLLAVLFISALAFTACSEDHDHDDDHDHGEEEVITTLTYTLTNSASVTDVVTLVFDDPDGDGSAQPTYTVSGPLTANATYTGTIKVENKTEDPAEDVTIEIQAEADEHEFFYTVAGGLNATVTKTDDDGAGNEFGLATSVATGAASTGTLTVVLKHEPTKPNDGTAANAGGSTDIEVTFNVTVQ